MFSRKHIQSTFCYVTRIIITQTRSGSWNRKIHAIDPSTGLSKWELDVEDVVEATAAIDREDNVYVGVWEDTCWVFKS